MTVEEILDRLLKIYRVYLDGDMKPVEGYDNTFYFTHLFSITSSIIFAPRRKLFWNSRHSAIT